MSSSVTASGRDFEASNSEYFSIASNSSLQLSNVDFAFSGWIKIESLDSSGSGVPILWKDDNSGSNKEFQFGYFFDTPSYKPYFGVKFDDGTSAFVNINTSLSTGVWYHLFAYHNASTDTIGISLNGGASSNTAATGGKVPNTGSSTLYMGKNGVAAPYFDGVMQSVGYWVGSIPTESDIYNSGNGVLYKDLSTANKTNLKSWWDLAETTGQALDAHGTNNLTDNNTVTSAAGKVTYTAEDSSQFTRANNEYLSITDGAQSGLDVTTGLYMCGWLYLDSTASGVGQNIHFAGKYGAAGSRGYLMYQDSADNKLWFGVSSDGTALTFIASTTALSSTGTWYFVQGYYNGSELGVSVNNETFVTTAYSSGIFDTTALFALGQSANLNSNNAYDGRQGFMAVYSADPGATVRTALYGRGFGIDYSDLTSDQKIGLVSWWKLTEASGSRADSHGSNTLTDNNTVTGNPGVVYDAPSVASPRTMMLLGVG